MRGPLGVWGFPLSPEEEGRLPTSRVVPIFLIVVIAAVLSVALLTAGERRWMGALQRRTGPNVVGYRGLLQPIADGVKLLIKESVLPLGSSSVVFLLSPTLLFGLALIPWVVLPVSEGVAPVPSPYGILVILAVGELAIWGVVYAGWAAASKYPLMGSLRSAAQMISYSVSLGVILLAVLIPAGSTDLLRVAEVNGALSLALPLLPLVPLLFVTLVAETNRAPFDLPEAESELVAGFMTEHSAVGFTMFFLAEYTNIIAAAYLGVTLFGGGLGVVSHSLAVTGVLVLVVWVRAALPRVRLDALLSMGWSNLLPLVCALLLFPLLLPL